MMHFFLTVLSLFLINIRSNAAFENVCVNLNDILSPKWMPATVFDKVVPRTHDYQDLNGTVNDFDKEATLDGSIEQAMKTMSFHRSMINQYLCRNYVANQIVAEVSKKSFHKRMGEELGMDEPNIKERETLKNNMLTDQGLASYEDWLRKSATLNDIYRNHNKRADMSDENLEDIRKTDIHENDKISAISTKHDHDYHVLTDSADYIIYDSGGHHNYYSNHPPAHYPPKTYYQSYKKPSYNKGEKLADLFELALTTLAFLSFGMFLLHLLMSISVVSNNMTTTVSTRIVKFNAAPAAVNAESYETGYGLDTESPLADSGEYRKFRSIQDTITDINPDNTISNEMAKRTLKIFSAAIDIDKDRGACLQNALCNASTYSRHVQGRNKLYMGLLSFGTSWLAENLSNQFVSKIQALQASLLGLGLANCDRIYKKCE
ncbi:uncharacterized protein LOC126738755 [Anthonomus grandis grandis]|uniref:uncharacterized protein LOC126738755 n=1 Tax=Anthonomus grandis grandis TaxID=2921223 RepID=UPI0021668747|nr:uncharacterized protein LOC126738755 [Anthonomus grandis grandis]